MDSNNRKFAIISVDTSDADYVSNITEVTEEQALVLARVANAIKTFEPYDGDEIFEGYSHKCRHNFPTGEMCRSDLGELRPEDYYLETGKISSEDFLEFLNLVPDTEYGFHTVTEIRILAVIGEIKLV